MLGLSGMLTGGTIGAHFGKMTALGPSGLWKGAAIGLLAGSAYDVMTPDTSPNKGLAGNILGGAALGVGAAAASTMGAAGLFPGGGLSRLLLHIDKNVIPKVAEWGFIGKGLRNFSKEVLGNDYTQSGLLEQLSAKSALARGMTAAPVGMGPGQLGFYGGFGPSRAWPEWLQATLGAPTLAKAVEATFGSPGGAKMIGDMGVVAVRDALWKDLLPSSAVGAGIGAGFGAMSNAYFGVSRRTPEMGIYGGGMYNTGGLASNTPINPIYSA